MGESLRNRVCNKNYLEQPYDPSEEIPQRTYAAENYVTLSDGNLRYMRREVPPTLPIGDSRITAIDYALNMDGDIFWRYHSDMERPAAHVVVREYMEAIGMGVYSEDRMTVGRLTSTLIGRMFHVY